MCEKRRRQGNYRAAIVIHTKTLLCWRTWLSRTSTLVSHRCQNLLRGKTHLYFQQGLKTFLISNNPGLHDGGIPERWLSVGRKSVTFYEGLHMVFLYAYRKNDDIVWVLLKVGIPALIFLLIAEITLGALIQSETASWVYVVSTHSLYYLLNDLKDHFLWSALCCRLCTLDCYRLGLLPHHAEHVNGETELFSGSEGCIVKVWMIWSSDWAVRISAKRAC